MTLHDSLFFKNPINIEPGRVVEQGSSNLVTEMTDNNYRTFSRITDVVINITDDQGDPTRVDYCFLKVRGRNIGYSITPIGGSGVGFTGRMIPMSVDNYEGSQVSTIVSGFQHDLYALPSPITAREVRLQVSGTDVQIHAVLLLELGYSIAANSRYTQIEFQKVDRTGSLTPNPTGRTRRNPPFAGTRFKWDGTLTCTFREKTELVAAFMAWAESNLNCAFAQEFSRYPARVYPATFPALRIANGYLDLMKSNGEFVQFRVAER